MGVGCAGRPPFLEYTLARRALKAAGAIHSDRHASRYWMKASRAYSTGKQKYQLRDYTSSKRYFSESLKWSQKAENLTRYKMSAGDVL